MGGRYLGYGKDELWKRYNDRKAPVKNPTAADLVTDKVEKLIVAVLTEFGLDYPLDFIIPPPDAVAVQRQATFVLQPTGFPARFGSSCRDITFKARKKGYLVIKRLDIIPEDSVGDENVTLKFIFGSQENSVNHQINKGDVEPGHWKFSGLVLADEDELTVRVCNKSNVRDAVVSMEADLWAL